MKNINSLTELILRYTFKVNFALGPGLLESSYKECLYYELVNADLIVEKEKALPIIYEKIKLEVGYRIDLLVEKQVIIEIKAVEALNDVHTAQVLTYLKLSGCRVGLLLNFNTSSLKNDIKRLML